jgi:glutaredoxin 3
MSANSPTVTTKQQKKIVVYTKDYCPYCVRAKRLLQARGYAFEEINIEGDDAKRQWLVDKTGQRTVPQIFIGELSVGGSDDLHELDRNGKLTELMRGE